MEKRLSYKIFNIFSSFLFLLNSFYAYFVNPNYAFAQEATSEPTTVVETTPPAIETPTTPESTPTEVLTTEAPQIEASILPSPTATDESVVQTGNEIINADVLTDDTQIATESASGSTEASLPKTDLSSSPTESSAQLVPNILTDKGDYSPTDVVTITGSGFAPNTTYELVITSETGNYRFSDKVTSNESGAIFYAYQLDGTSRPLYTVNIYLGGTSVAIITFTDPSYVGPIVEQEIACMAQQPTAPDPINCTANDISLGSVSNITIIRSGPDPAHLSPTTSQGCDYPGQYIEFTASWEVLSTAEQRYNVGLWFAAEGQADALYGTCSASTLPTGPTPFFEDTDDSCGDILGKTTGIVSPPITLIAQCIAAPGTNQLNLPYCTSWDNNEREGNACSSPTQTVAGTPSKCNCQSANPIPITVPPAIEVIKSLTPSTDTGKFNLFVNNTTVTDQGDGGTTGKVTVSTGTNTIGESAGTGTSLSNYSTSVSCVLRGTTTPVNTTGTNPSWTLDVSNGQDIVCTITNTLQQGSLTVIKHVEGGTAIASDWTMHIENTSGDVVTPFAGAESPGTTNSLLQGDYHVYETDGPSGYTLTYEDDCDSNGNVTVTAGQTATCTLVNTRDTGKIIVNKVIDPTSDSGKFDLLVDGVIEADDVGNGGTTGEVTVDTGLHSISELAGTGTDLIDYDSTVYCGTDNPVTGTALSDIQVNKDQTETCVFTNTLKRGSISGYKYEDSDGDINTTGDRSVIQGWVMELWQWVTDIFVNTGQTDTTDINGYYSFVDLLPGLYKVIEQVPVNWTTISPDNIEINLTPGQDSQNNNFINFENVDVTACKKIDADGDVATTQDQVVKDNWTVYLRIDGQKQTPGQVIGQGGCYTWSNLGPGHAYGVEEDVPSGWSARTATSHDFGQAASGEDYSFTFINTELGSISVTKDANPGDTGDEFNLVLSQASPIDSRLLENGETGVFSDLMPGTYYLYEIYPAGNETKGWYLDHATCDGQLYDFGDPINLSAGQTVSCTFYNIQRGKIIVDKVTVPGEDPAEFDFELESLSQNVIFDTFFSLTDLEAPFESSLLQPGMYSATETIPLGWALTSATCSDSSDPSSITLDPGETVTCTFTNNKPSAQIDLTPLEATNKIGDNHVITATVQINNGSGVWGPAADGTLVDFDLINNNAGASFVGSDSCTTVSGSCSVTIVATNTGSVEIEASASPIILGVPVQVATDGLGENSTAASKLYANARISITPATFTNEVGDPHDFTVTVEQDTGSGFDPVPAGTLANAIAIPTPDGGLDASDCNDGVNASGQCTVTINSSVAGVFTIIARSTVDINGVIFKLQTNGSGANSPAATKTYVDANIDLSPLQATNGVGQPHTITATVLEDPGTGQIPADGELVTFILIDNTAGASFVGGNTCITGLNGECSVDINSVNHGSVDIHGLVDVSVGGLTLSRESDSTHGSSGNANKIYEAGNIIVAKQTIPDGAGDEFEFDPSWSTLNFTLSDGEEEDSGPLAPGTYSVAELTPGGNWDLTDMVCGEEGSPSNIILSAGETVRCTFTNTLRQPELTIEKSNNKPAANAGDTVTYTLKVTNTGNTNVGNITVTDILPAGFSYITGTAVPDVSSVNGQILVWNNISLDSGESITITYDATIATDQKPATYPNLATCQEVFGEVSFAREPVECNDGIPVTSDVTLSFSNSYGGNLTSQVLGAATELPATGSSTDILFGAILLLIVGLILKFGGKRIFPNLYKLMKKTRKSLKISIILAVLMLGLSAGSAKAVTTTVAISDLPQYTNQNDFFISYTAIADDPANIQAQFYYSKEGDPFQAFGPVFTGPSNKLEVTGTQMNESNKKYYFKVVINSGADDDMTSTIYDNSGPDPVSNYSKERLGATTYQIKWHTPGNNDFAQVIIYKSDNPDFSADSAHFAFAQGGTKNTDYSWIDNGIDPTKNYYYLIRALDFAGNSSGLVGDAYVTQGPTTSVTASPIATGGRVVTLPKESAAGEVLGEEATPTPTAVPAGGIVGKTVELAKNRTWLFALIIIVIGAIAYFIYRRFKKNK